MKFKVKVVRTVTDTAYITVEAENAAAAERIADDADLNFEESPYEYEVTCEEV